MRLSSEGGSRKREEMMKDMTGRDPWGRLDLDEENRRQGRWSDGLHGQS